MVGIVRVVPLLSQGLDAKFTTRISTVNYSLNTVEMNFIPNHTNFTQSHGFSDTLRIFTILEDEDKYTLRIVPSSIATLCHLGGDLAKYA